MLQWLKKLVSTVSNLISAAEQSVEPNTHVESSLSAEQQTALFLGIPALESIVALRPSTYSGFDKRIGAVVMLEMSPEVAKWAIPYAERIREAEELFKTNRITEAIAKFEEIQSLIPNAAIVLMDMGVCHAEIGDRSAALSWLNKAFQVAPSEYKALIQENLRRLQSQ
jgi:Flp pilus assembly protein TadD